MHRRWMAGLRFEQAAHHIVLEDCIAAVEAATPRRDRLEAHIEAALPDWSLAPVVRALQALRGMALVAAATVIAELGDITRFANPRQLMAYLGLVSSEHSSGATRRQGGITKAGNGAARRMCDPAWKSGSDSLLMNLRRRCGLVSRGNQGHAVFSCLRVAPHGVLRGRCVEPRRQRRPYNPSDEREQCVPIMWCGFGPGPQSISSPLGGLTDRRAARRADAPGATLPLRGGSVRAAHLYRTLRRQHPQALGASHGSNSIRLSIV